MACLRDEDYDKLNKNAFLFISVRENTLIDKKIKNVEQCLEQGGDVNAVDGNDGGNTPLHVAAHRGEVALVSLLLDKGADVTCMNKNQKTPLDVARAHHTKHKEVVILLENAEISASEHGKRNPKEDDLKWADVNDGADTPLSETVRYKESSAVNLLLDKDADITRKFWNEDTPLYVPSKHYTQNKDIVDLLESAEKLVGDTASTNNKNGQWVFNGRSQPPFDIFQSNDQAAIPNEAVRNKALPEYTYNKREGTSSAKGYLYEIKLLSLILIRVLNDKQIQDFLLGSNIDGIGALDDICLWCRVKGQESPFRLFVQTKHRQDPEKKRLTLKEVKTSHGDFSLDKYFESYIMILDKFQTNNKDPMFKGDFIDANFVIYTSACVSHCFEFQDIMKITEHNVNQKAHHLIHTNPNINPIQYKYDEGDIDLLANKTVVEQLKQLGAVFLELLTSQRTTKEEYDMILLNKLIAKYHVVMGRKILQHQKATNIYREWGFRPDFFENHSEYMVALKSTFNEEMSTKRCDLSEITSEDRNNIMEVLQDPSATNISKLIGKLATYNKNTETLLLVKYTDLRKEFEPDEFMAVQKWFCMNNLSKNIVCEAVQIKLTSMKIRLPLAFGNLDMNFRGGQTRVHRRIKAVAIQIIELFANKDANIVDINNDVVGPEKTIKKGITDLNGGIGSAVGNLLILDPYTNALKFQLDNKLPDNAALLLKELKKVVSKEKLRQYRINVNINGFPIYSFNDNECIKRQVRDYLDKLMFYANQAKEHEVDDIIKHHINEYYHGSDPFTIAPDFILLTVHDEIQKWSFESGSVKYLSRASDPFKRARVKFINDLFKCIFSIRD